jgi:polysaccharide biosynthesis/export protein
MKKYIFLVLTLMLFSLPVFSQIPGVPTEAQIMAKMEQNEITREELETKLKEKGFDIQSVDVNDPTQVSQAAILIDQTLNEIIIAKGKDKKKKTQQITDNPQVQKEDNNEVIKDEPKEVDIPKKEKKPKKEEKEKEEGEDENEEEKEKTPKKKKNTKVEEDEAFNKSTEEIQKAVEDGATYEEAVSEKISEKLEESLPPAVTWGQQAFRDKKISTYQQSRDVKPPLSYVLGPGDRIGVSIWGYSQENVVFEINEDGYIKPEAMPRIYLKGITIGKAKALLESRFHSFYRFKPEEFEVTLNFSRTITVNVVGEVFNYGSFTLPARNTAFNALAATGGPTNIGSVRKIKLIRSQQEPILIDIYKFLLNPAAEDNLFLQENDYIFVPMVDRVVTIKGSIRRPFQYELIEGENLKQLVEYASGLTVDSHTDNIEIVRTINGKQSYIDVNLTTILNGGSDFPLKNGDVINIRTIKTTYQNYINVAGTVEVNGNFELKKGMRISDIVNRAILKKEARTDFAMLVRKKNDGTNEIEKINLAKILADSSAAENLLLLPEDSITIYPLARFIDNATVNIKGAVRAPAQLPYDFAKDFTLENYVMLSGGLRKDALEYAYVHRVDFANPARKNYIRVNIKRAISNPTSVDNLILEPFDEVIIYSEKDFSEEYLINTAGALRNPDEFPYEPGLKVSDLIYFSNGLKTSATDFGYIYRFDPYNPGFKQYLKVNVKEAFENPESDANFEIKPKDQFFVFDKSQFNDEFKVEVFGEVRNPQAFQTGAGLTLKDALTLSGGLKLEASKSRIEIYRILITEQQETQTVVAKFSIDNDLNIIAGSATQDIELQRFDQIYVRKVPDFELQQIVTIQGEIYYPGEYPIITKNERLLEFIERSGGLTSKAFPAGAKLYRNDELEKGYVLLKLDKLLKSGSKRANQKYNFVLKPDDVIIIPEKKDLVSILTANTNMSELVDSALIESGRISVGHVSGKNAKYYIKRYAGGRNKMGRNTKITVLEANGRFRKTRSFLFFKKYPKVTEGSIVAIGAKKVKEKKKDDSKGLFKDKFDSNKFIRESFATLTSTISLILLLRQL